MFILTRINQQMGVATVYDTNDKSNDNIDITVLAQNIVSGKVKVYGLPKLEPNKTYTYMFPNLGIAVDNKEATRAMQSANMKESRRTYNG